jgi:purine-binding chemotaxis protein CheW
MSTPKTPAASFDWAAIAERVAHSLALLENAGQPGPDQHARILRERAIALASPGPLRDTDDAGPGSLEVLVFQVGGEGYGFETRWVAQVIPMLPVTLLPGVPNHIVGIVPFGGEALAVLDLRSLLALPLAQLAEATALVVLRGEQREFAVLAETIVGVQRYAREALEPSLPALANIERSYLQGVAPDRTALLDAGQLLTDPTLVVHADR